VLNAIEFFKENDINPIALYLPLIKAYGTLRQNSTVTANSIHCNKLICKKKNGFFYIILENERAVLRLF